MLLINKLLGIVPMVYREGGGKSGGGQVATPPPVNTMTSIGNQLDAPVQTLEEEDKTSMIDRKKLGTRGLQIPKTEAKPVTGTVLGVQL